MTIAQELQKSNTSPYVEMIDVDGTGIDPFLRFFFTNSSDQSFGFGGQTWTPFPYQLTGCEVTTDQPPRPKLTISNVTKILQPYLQTYQDLVNVKVTRRRTLYKYLDGQSTADSSQEMPKEIYFITMMTRHDRELIEFELSTVYDLPGVKLPRAQALKDDLNIYDGSGNVLYINRNMYAPGLSTVRFRGA